MTKINTRLEKLKEEIERQFERIRCDSNTEPLEVIKLFYYDFAFPQYNYIRIDGVNHKILV